ncbi:hypothetical protein HMPREF1531_01484 [Propionibacterium sp. oral taxon 192 str. F0372]|nr:hypothetical protein HMPREF1531_01484 [Propionibacterium sp. oral taxon 192 str. F0372]
MPLGICVDAPGLRARILHIGEWSASSGFDRGTCLGEVIHQKIKMNLLLAASAWPSWRLIIGNAVEGEPSYWGPNQREPLIVTIG